MVRNYKRKTEDRWSKEDLLEALTLIRDSKLKINDAARQFGISRATLYRQYQKFLLAGGKCDINQFRTCGGNPILTKVEEDVLEKTIIDLREQGFSVTSSDIKRICFEYCDSNTIPNQFNKEKRMASDDWYYGFLKRHPGISLDVRTGRLSVGCELINPIEIAHPIKRRKRSSAKGKRRSAKRKRYTVTSVVKIEKTEKSDTEGDQELENAEDERDGGEIEQKIELVYEDERDSDQEEEDGDETDKGQDDETDKEQEEERESDEEAEKDPESNDENQLDNESGEGDEEENAQVDQDEDDGEEPDSPEDVSGEEQTNQPNIEEDESKEANQHGQLVNVRSLV